MDQPATGCGSVSTGPHLTRVLYVCGTILLGAILFMAPSLFNGRPFFFWDTASYMGVAKLIFAADPSAAIVDLWNDPALLVNPPTSVERQALLEDAASNLGARNLWYSVFLERGLHFLSFWGVAFIQCLLVSGALFGAMSLVWRNGSRIFPFLVVCAFAAALTSGGIVSTLLLPDSLAAALLLLLALLLARHDLQMPIVVAIFIALCVTIAMHPTYAPIAFVTTGAGAISIWLRSRSLRAALRPIAVVVGAIGVSLSMNIWLSALADQEIGVPLERPPFLLGRVIDDGPGRRYLEENCASARFEICKYRDRVLGQKAFGGDSVLFRREISGGAVYMVEPMDVRARLREEELPFARAAVLAYPMDQLVASAKNVVRLLAFAQLNKIGSSLSDGYTYYARAVGLPGTNAMLEGLPGVEKCRQNPKAPCGDLNLQMMRYISYATFLIGAAVLGWIVLGFIVRHRLSLAKLDITDAFVLIIIIGVVVNAVVCGILGGPYDRYQTRVSWLLPAIALAVIIFSPDKLLSPRELFARLRAERADV